MLDCTNANNGAGQSLRRARYVNTVRNFFHSPYNIITTIAIAYLFYFIAVPLWGIVESTFIIKASDARASGMPAGSVTLYYWLRVFASKISNSMLYKPLLNSLYIGVCVSVLSIALGTLMAWVMVRTDIAYKRLFSFAIILPYMMPSWYKAMAWLEVFRNERIGGHSGFFYSVFGIQPPNWLAYGFIPIVITLSLHYYVYAYLLMSSALTSMNSELEEMAEITGASRLTIWRKITIPLMLPAMLSAVILTFSKAIGTFGVPAYLGLKVNYHTLSTMLYSNIKSRQSIQAYILSLVLIVISMIVVYVNQRAIGSRKNFTTLGGKGGRSTPVTLGKWKRPITALFVAFIAVFVLFPVFILVIQSFMLKSGDYSFSNFTLHFWLGESTPLIADGEPGLLRNPLIIRSSLNTFRLVVVVSIIASILGLMLGYIVSRGRKRLSGRIVDQLAFAPYVIPSISLGAIYLSMFSTPHFVIPSLYGTFTLLVLISVVKYMPFSCKSGTSSMMQISPELEEAACVSGVGFVQRFRRIIMPIAKSGLFSGFLLIFISAMKELDLIVLLTTPANSTLTKLTFSYSESGAYQFSNALTTLILLVVVAVYLLAVKVGKADMTKGIGG